MATEGLWAAVVVALAAYVGTDLDNAAITTAQIALAPADRARRIVKGQILGFTAVVAVSGLAALVLLEFPTSWIGLLGLVPIALGLRAFLALRDPEVRAGRMKWPAAAGVTSSALVTIGNSGDNLGVYIPLLRGGTPSTDAVTIAVFALCEVGFCFLVLYAGRHPRTLRALERGGAFVAPFAYCAIGVYVLVRAGTPRAIF